MRLLRLDILQQRIGGELAITLLPCPLFRSSDQGASYTLSAKILINIPALQIRYGSRIAAIRERPLAYFREADQPGAVWRFRNQYDRIFPR